MRNTGMNISKFDLVASGSRPRWWAVLAGSVLQTRRAPARAARESPTIISGPCRRHLASEDLG